jgi:hypothetical protein
MASAKVAILREIMSFSKALLMTLVFSLSATAFARNNIDRKPWHQLLDLSSREYQKINAQRAHSPQNLFMSADLSAADPALQTILQVGARNLQWVDAINKARPQAQWILLTTPETQHAYPMDKPSVYNGDLVVKEYNGKMQAMNAAIATVLTGTETLPSVPPVDDVEFTTAVRAIDQCYQTASRWLMMKPYLNELAQEKRNDVRGYYFLSQMTDRQQKLQNFSSLGGDERKQIREWLLEMCLNAKGDETVCSQEFSLTINNKADLNALYMAYETSSKALYQSYFSIPAVSRRPDMIFANIDGVDTFIIPFLTPTLPRVLSFVRDNVEAEWTQASITPWALKLNMVGTDDGKTPHVEFQAGATPHVNDIAGNIITMDQNVSLDDYGNNWTIRHEFGHVLGFPDCYLEFYDKDQGVMTNYQLDITNVMCSRRGHIQDLHYHELKRAYGR